MLIGQDFEYKSSNHGKHGSYVCWPAEQVRKRPLNSVLTLTIVEKGKFNSELVDYLKDLTKGNTPYVRKAAVVGIAGLYKVVISAISIFSKRDFKLFETKEEAVRYLLED